MKIITILFMLFVVVGLAAVGSKKKVIEGKRSKGRRTEERQPCQGIVDNTAPSGCAPCPNGTKWNGEQKRCINRCSEPTPYWNDIWKKCRTLEQQRETYNCMPDQIYEYPNTCACPKSKNWNRKTSKCEDACPGSKPFWDDNRAKCVSSLM